MTENKALMNETTEIMTVNKADLAAPSQLDKLTDANSSFFCSIKADGTRKSAIAIYNAINNKGESLDDHFGEVLEIVHVAAHPVSLVDEKTGEVVDTLRTVLVDKKGKNYDAVSEGIASSLQKIFAIVGMPPWIDEPLKIKVVQQKTRAGYKTNTIELV